MHKGFKCLDVAEGRVYISRDVIFYETIFPFASLHSNAAAHLRREILLLPGHLKIPLLNTGGNNCEPNLISSPASNVGNESAGLSSENSEPFELNFGENPGHLHHFYAEWRQHRRGTRG